METKIEAQLASELQEMYLENKEWQSDILFLEDEMRFFQQLFERSLANPVQKDNVDQFIFINARLTELKERGNHLKGVLDKRQLVLAAMLMDEVRTITIAFIEEDSAIISEIKSLLATDREVRKELFALIEDLMPKVKSLKFPNL